jgi:hypothetical protein
MAGEDEDTGRARLATTKWAKGKVPIDPNHFLFMAGQKKRKDSAIDCLLPPKGRD